MRRTEIRVEGPEAFFERGRKYARMADRGERIPYSRIIAFEDMETLLSVLTERRVTLIKQVKQKPGSITVLASRLGRDRSAVTRDVQLLERVGVIQVTLKTLPGHGKQKWVSPVARSIQLTAEL